MVPPELDSGSQQDRSLLWARGPQRPERSHQVQEAHAVNAHLVGRVGHYKQVSLIFASKRDFVGSETHRR